MHHAIQRDGTEKRDKASVRGGGVGVWEGRGFIFTNGGVSNSKEGIQDGCGLKEARGCFRCRCRSRRSRRLRLRRRCPCSESRRRELKQASEFISLIHYESCEQAPLKRDRLRHLHDNDDDVVAHCCRCCSSDACFSFSRLRV